MGPNLNNTVVLVDERGRDLANQDGSISTEDKVKVHLAGLLHSAVSIFIFNDRNELLLQKRADNKYHSGGRWTNTCCTHPFPGETPIIAARRRLNQEMGITAELKESFSFSYKVEVGDGMIENEFDHVFIGLSNQNPKPDPDEVSNWTWKNIKDLIKELAEYPEKYSPWLALCFDKVVEYRLGNELTLIRSFKYMNTTNQLGY
jgi:isopentenyl-diphosphate Delta-isomerase